MLKTEIYELTKLIIVREFFLNFEKCRILKGWGNNYYLLNLSFQDCHSEGIYFT